MSISSVPPIQFTSAGLVLPTDSEILTAVRADMDTAFGGGLNPALETPQGQLASSQTAIIADKNSEIAYIVNQVDPQYAEGRFQDAIGRIYFLTRKPAQPTIVYCDVTGIPGTVIPAGTLAQDTNSYKYVATDPITIGISGTTTGTQWQNVENGPIPCATGALSQVYQAVVGWDSITNPAEGVLGTNLESRADFEYRRKNSVALNGRGTNYAIYSNVFAIDGVLECFVIDNPTASPITYGSTSYTVEAHSLLVSVVGGDNDAIANAIWEKKDCGCSMNGNTTVTVTDTNYSYPQPTYNIKFLRPSAYTVKFAVQITSDPALPSDIVDRVKNAIIARFNGADGSVREQIAKTIFAGQYYAAVASTSPVVAIQSIAVGHSVANLLSLPIGVDQYPTLTSSDIAVSLV